MERTYMPTANRLAPAMTKTAAANSCEALVQAKPRLPARTEWPTVLLFAAVYGLFGAITWFHVTLPVWALAMGGGFLVALHGSLQHEAIHGHPTPWHRVNRALVFPSLWLWVPYELYRGSHLAHHRDERLTDPIDDPESFYLEPEAWRGLNAPARALYVAHNTLVGRLLIGPWLCVYRLARAELPRLLQGRRDSVTAWSIHVLSVALVLAWVLGVAGMPLWLYLLTFVYPGIALTLLRSFAEHRAHPAVERRTAIVEAGPLLSLLFLNNNLHAVHHAQPGLPWHAIPASYRASRRSVLRNNGGYLFAGGYGELFRRYAFRPKEPPAHPCLPAMARDELSLKPPRMPTPRGGPGAQAVPLAPDR
jgi:fatty acid desaturase